MPNSIDIHAHMNFSAYDEDRDEVIKRALDNGTWMINVGTKESTSREAVKLAESYDEGVYAIIGLHPIHTSASFHDKDEIGEEGASFNSKGEEFNVELYRELAKSKKVVGIGECGLDYFRIDGDSKEYKDRQEKAFRAQIELTIELDIPLMIHCRNAYTDTLQILREYKEKVGDKLRGNFHFFAGTKDEAQEILDLGFNMSFTGVITFAKDYEDLVRMIPIERIFSETDCPYVTPVPYRGKRNEPMYVEEVVKKIAELKNLDIEKTKEILISNAFSFFRL